MAFLTKTSSPGQVAPFQGLKSMPKDLLEMEMPGELQPMLLLGPDQLAGNHQQLHADRLEGLVAIAPGQTEPLEVVDDVEGQQKELEERDVRNPVLGRDMGQGIIVGQFADMLFDHGSRGIEQVHSPRADLQVGDENVVGVPLVLEELELLGLDRIVRDRPAHDNEPMLLAFAPRLRPVPKLPDLPAVGHLGEVAALHLGLDGRALDRNDHVPIAFLVEEFDHALAEEPRVDAKTDTGAGDVFWDLGQADLDEGLRPGRGSSIPWTQRAVPEFSKAGLEGQQRMVGTSPALLGVVAHARPFDLPAINHDHRGIDIEDQAGALARPVEQSLSKQLVHSDNLSDVRGSHPLQEPADGGFVRKTIQANKSLERSVVLENLRLVDTVHACDDRVEDCEHHIRRLEIAEARPWSEMLLEQLPQTQLLTKTLDQVDAREVREVGFLEGNDDFSETFWHYTQKPPRGVFLCRAILAFQFSCLSSRIRSMAPGFDGQIAHH